MQSSTFKALLTILAVAVVATGCASGGGGAPAAPPVHPAVGSWTMTIETPAGTQTPEVSISEANGGYSGTFSSPQGELAFDSVTPGEGAVEFQVTVDIGGQDLVMKFSGSVEGDSMDGSFATDFGDFAATAVRKVE